MLGRALAGTSEWNKRKLRPSEAVINQNAFEDSLNFTETGNT